jgi:hypothetical protein
MLAAIKLDERLRQQRMYEEEGTHMRSFFRELIDENGPDSDPYWGRPDALHEPALPEPGAEDEYDDWEWEDEEDEADEPEPDGSERDPESEESTGDEQ